MLSGSKPAPQIAGFEYISVLGTGGFSDVYLYQQKLPRRQVAVKVLHVDALERQARKQFVAEANLMAQLSSHPAIATIYTAGISDDDQPYFVMEFCSGGSLAVSYRSAPLSVEEVLRIGVRLSSALESAHRAGITHRDVKPANILITDYDAPVLTDFGISVGDDGVAEATMFRGGDVTTTSASGTTHGLSIPWAPPEALEDVPVNDARSDVYSLGATLFSLLEGRTPFEVVGASNGPAQLLRRIERKELNPFSRTDVPAELVELIYGALSPVPANRPQSALALGEALRSIELSVGLAATPLEVRAQSMTSVAAIDEAEETSLRTPVGADARAPLAADADPTVLRPAVPPTAALSAAILTIPPSVTHAATVAPPPGISRGTKVLIALVSAGILLLGASGIALAAAAQQGVFDTAASEATNDDEDEGLEPEPGSTPSETPTSAVNQGAEIPMCPDAYFAAMDDFYADANYTVHYESLTEPYEPLAVAGDSAPFCGYQSWTDDDKSIASQSIYYPIATSDLLLAQLAQSYVCTMGSFDDTDCADGAHHVGLAPFSVNQEYITSESMISVYISAFKFCPGDTNCWIPEPW